MLPSMHVYTSENLTALMRLMQSINSSCLSSESGCERGERDRSEARPAVFSLLLEFQTTSNMMATLSSSANCQERFA